MKFINYDLQIITNIDFKNKYNMNTKRLLYQDWRIKNFYFRILSSSREQHF